MSAGVTSCDAAVALSRRFQQLPLRKQAGFIAALASAYPEFTEVLMRVVEAAPSDSPMAG